VKANILVIDAAIDCVTEGFKEKLLQKGILHNDFNYANGLYDEKGNLTSFLDTEQLGVGPYTWDLGNTLASFYSKFKSKMTQKEFEERVRAFLQRYHQIHPLPHEEYELILASTERWDVMRVLRTLRRHHYEGNRFPELLPKITERLLPRLRELPSVFNFMTKEWIKETLS
jgi:Ser/Thr protein kinase RdoA (MazF antagonist)